MQGKAMCVRVRVRACAMGSNSSLTRNTENTTLGWKDHNELIGRKIIEECVALAITRKKNHESG